VKTGELDDGVIHTTEETVTPAGIMNSSAKIFPAGTLLIAMYGATIGKLALLGIPAATNQACAALLPDGDVGDLIPYVFLYLRGKRGVLKAMGQGGAQPNLSQGLLKDFPIDLPPLAEQRRIVAKLEDLLAGTRRAKEALDAVPLLLEKLRQSILGAAFRGDLTGDWRAKNPDVEVAEKLLARVRTERRKKWQEAELAKMKAKGKPPTDARWKDRYADPEPVDAALPELPDAWAWASLESLSFLVGGLTKGQKRKGTERLRAVPYLRVANVQRGHLDLSEVKEIEATEQEIEELQLQPGDVLLNEGGDRDKLGRGWIWSGELPECIHQNHVFRARPVSRELEPAYLSGYANTFGQAFFVDAGKQTTNLASVSMSKVRRFPVALPPADEQREIVRVVGELLAGVARQRDDVDAAAVLLERLEAAALAKAFRGELVPQDPNDEPADVMLARVGAASAQTKATPASRPRSSRSGTAVARE
jgi:type I restriction enzyme S subunit